MPHRIDTMFSTPMFRNIRLLNFRNYREAAFGLGRKVTVISGPNGTGKTNLLDALYYACMTRSYFAGQDNLVFGFGADFFRIDAEIIQDADIHRIEIKNIKQGKKEVFLDGVPVERLSDLVGRFPSVFVTPDDNQLILGGSEMRRKLIDATLCQTDPAYLQHLLQYNRLLNQRNALLRSFGETGRPDRHLLDTYDEKLVVPGEAIYRDRTAFLAQFRDCFLSQYAGIFQGNEQVQLDYTSVLADVSFPELLRRNQGADLSAQRTTAGIHTDDLVFGLNGYPLKKTGSQGQQKTFLLALKLAQYAFIQKERGVSPFLFLDDIFDKLDGARTAQLIGLVTGEHFGQVFITDTDPERIERILAGQGISGYQSLSL